MTRKVSYALPILKLLDEAPADNPWLTGLVIVGHLRRLVPPERAMHLYPHWVKGADVYEVPVETMVSRGAKFVIRSKLSNLKVAELIEQKGPRGDQRLFRITEKGRRKLEALKGNGRA